MYNRKNNKTEKNEPVYFDIVKSGAVVTNVRKINDKCVGFTLRCNGFSLYNLRAVQSKDGGWFISVPATKGKDGKYYNNYGLYLRDEDEDALLDTIFDILDM